MALVLADRVQETTTTTGTGTVTLAGAVSGFQSFAAVGNANTTYYTIAGQTTSEFEIGIGTYTTSGTTLSRDTILTSSNSNLAVNFSAGTKNVFVTYPASRSVYVNGTTITPTNSGILPVASGGTGITTTPTNGQLLVGNGTNYTVATLGSGTGISTTTGAGTLTVNNTGVTSNVAGTGISVSGATGAVTVTNSGVTSNVAGTGISVSGATGAVTVTNSGVTSIVAGTGISVSGATGAVTVTSTVTGATITGTTTSGTYYVVGTTSTSGSLTTASISNTNVVSYNASTGALSAVSHVSSSDESLKTNWRDVEPNFIEQLAEVKSGIFDRIEGGNTEAGVSAQSLQKVLAEAVITGEDGKLSVNYGGAALVACIQLSKRVLELEAKLDQLLKGNI